MRAEPEARRLRGRMTVWVPPEGIAGRAVCFRAWANAPQVGARLEVGGAVSWSPDRTAFTVTLPAPPTGPVEISLVYTLTVPARTTGYGLMQKLPDGRMVLYYPYPELARVESGRCRLDPPWPHGDLLQADVAHFAVRLAGPPGMEVAASGVERAAGEGVWEIRAAFLRNFVLVLGPMAAEEVQTPAGVRVRAWTAEGDGRRMAELAADALSRFSEAFGPYPHADLEVVEVPLAGGAAGVEAGALVLIGEDVRVMEAPMDGLDLLGFVVAHEVGHQWWYELVGNDARREPWLDESLTNWSSVWWVEQAHGAEAAEMAWDPLVLLPYRLRLAEGDLPLDLPVDRLGSDLDYAAIVYGKGAWAFEALRREIGEERFFAFLRRYLSENRWGWATGERLRAALAAEAGEAAAEAFFAKWVRGKGITAADLPEGGPMAQLLSDPSMGELMRALLEAAMQNRP